MLEWAYLRPDREFCPASMERRNQMKKKVFALTLTGVMALGLAACGGSSASTASSAGSAAAAAQSTSAAAPAAAGDVSINLIHFKTEAADQFDAAAEAYKAATGVTVNMTCSNDYNTDLKAAMSTDDMPTIFCLDGPEDLLEWDGYVEDLSDQPWVDMVFEGYLNNMTKDGKVYGLPQAVEGYGFIYNKEIFEAAGVDIASCLSVEDFDAAFGALKEKIDAGELADQFPNLEAVVSFPAGEGWVPGLHTSNLFISAEFDGDALAASQGELTMKYAADFQKLIDLQVKYTAFADDPMALNSVDYSAQVSSLITENVAVIQQGNWVGPEILNADPELLPKLGMIAMPIGNGYDGKLPVGVSTNFCVNAKSSPEQIAAAKDFLTWLYTSDEGKNFVANEFRFIPVMEGYEEFQSDNTLINDIMDYASRGETLNWVLAAYPSGWSDGVMGMNIQKYIAGEETWDECIAEVVAQWNALKMQG